MSYNRAYTVGEEVRVDQYAMGLNPMPTLGPCTLPAVVKYDSPAANSMVHLEVEGYPSLSVYKDRVTP